LIQKGFFIAHGIARASAAPQLGLAWLPLSPGPEKLAQDRPRRAAAGCVPSHDGRAQQKFFMNPQQKLLINL
jgi:hypothetical protein